MKGVGGTRNLDFWFADEAVMVDTAGRYTTQDSDYQVDSHGWTSFLSLLKKHRPLQPVNGIIVAIGLDELIGSDCAKIDAHAKAVRRRLVELRKTLEVAAPVYVMLTKADLLAGFTEYYDDLDVEGRRACAWRDGRLQGWPGKRRDAGTGVRRDGASGCRSSGKARVRGSRSDGGAGCCSAFPRNFSPCARA